MKIEQDEHGVAQLRPEVEDQQVALVRQVIADWRWGYWVTDLDDRQATLERLRDHLWDGWQGLNDMDRPALAQEYVQSFLENDDDREAAWNRAMELARVDDFSPRLDWSAPELWEFIVADASLRLPEFKG